MQIPIIIMIIIIIIIIINNINNNNNNNSSPYGKRVSPFNNKKDISSIQFEGKLRSTK